MTVASDEERVDVILTQGGGIVLSVPEYLIERDERGVATWVHSPDCGGYCDYACSGSFSWGGKLADVIAVQEWLNDKAPRPGETAAG